MTLPLRPVVFWMHLVAGVSAAAIVLLMSVTGVLLAYEKQIIRWADGYKTPPATAGQARLPLEDLVARASDGRTGPPPTVTVRRALDAPVEVAFGREGTVFVNPYTGEILGSGATSTRAFFRSTMEWHRWLALKDASRPVGKAITGISNLIFLFIVISGFYLWWPRTWTWTQFRQVLWFRGGLRGKARDFNWHHVIGYWSLVPLAVIVWSGVVIGYPWASDLTYRMVGEAPPRPPAAAPAGARPEGGRAAEGGRRAEADAAPVTPPASLPLGTLLARAEAHDASWRLLSVRVPSPRETSVTVTVDTGTGAQPQKKGSLVLDRATGTTTRWEPFEAQSAGRQWRSWMRFVHTGEYYGVFGQTVAMVVTAGACVLVWTGLALTWRRFVAWRARGVVARTRAAQLRSPTTASTPAGTDAGGTARRPGRWESSCSRRRTGSSCQH